MSNAMVIRPNFGNVTSLEWLISSASEALMFVKLHLETLCFILFEENYHLMKKDPIVSYYCNTVLVRFFSKFNILCPAHSFITFTMSI